MEKGTIRDITKELFHFKRWSEGKTRPETFVGGLEEFFNLYVYDHFYDYIQSHAPLEEVWQELGVTLEDIFLSEPAFHRFLERRRINAPDLTVDDLYRPILVASAKGVPDAREFVHLLSDFKTRMDLLDFLNDVLEDHGHIVHGSGKKNEYELIDLY